MHNCISQFLKTTFLLLFIIILSCKENSTSSTSTQGKAKLSQDQIKDLFRYIDASASGINFDNSIRDSLEFNIFYYEYNYNGGGVAIGDVNNDGLPDVYFSGTFVPNRLYINLGNLKFKDVTEQAKVSGGPGLKTGVSFVDINNDGLLDIYVCKSGKVQANVYRQNVLYVNKGNLQFQEEAEKYGIADPSYSTQAYWADIDIDGDIDLFLVNHPIGWGKQDRLELAQDAKGNISVVKDTARYLISDRLYINESGKFKDKTKQYKVDNIAFGLSAMIADVNEDGYPDIYVANDYTAPDHMYINQRGIAFKDESEKYFSNITASSMGCDMADFNGDGVLDLFVNDMMPEDVKRMKENKNFSKNYDSHLIGKKFKYHDQFRYNAMQIKSGKEKFENVSFYTHTSNTDWSWAVLGEDFDHNGHNDLFITNGYLKDVVNMDYGKYVLDSLKKNVTQKLFYGEWVKKVPEAKLTNYFYANNGNLKFDNVSNHWCDGRKSFSNGAAYGDLDNDGDLDLVVNNINDAAFVMENTLPQKLKSHFATISLKGGANNIHGYGAVISASLADGTKITKLFNPYRGYMSSVDQRIHIGSNQAIQSMDVTWPEGGTESFAFSSNGAITLEKGKGKIIQNSKTWDQVHITPLSWKHKENEYIDFKREPLLHMKNSVEGPTLSVADIEGDGNEEVYVGGAAGQAGSILTYKNNSWQTIMSPDFLKDSVYEDVASTFADIDNDGDQDLIVASGGYQYSKGAELYKTRLYLNDGKGNFIKDISFPDIRTNASSICAADFDGDKDIDIFIGAGALPNAYPKADLSIYLQNDRGKFSDKTATKIVSKIGIVKDCVAHDINKDGLPDLILAGDWAPITVLVNDKTSFSDKTKDFGLDRSNGLWQDILVTDIDGDGDNDIIAGNLGTNSFFTASYERPTSLYSSDFDGNGEQDAIMCKYYGDKIFPVHPLDKVLTHMTSLRKKFLRYAQYGSCSIDEMFDSDKLNKAEIFNAYTFESSVFYNSSGKFDRKPLPIEVQFSMVKDMHLIDENGVKKLAVVGNFWDTDFDFGKYDASHGVLLDLQKGITTARKDIGATGNIREFEMVKINNKYVYLLGENNGFIQQIEFK